MKKRRRHADPAAGLLRSADRGKEKPHPKGDPGEPDEQDSWSPSHKTNHCKPQIMLQVLVGQRLLQKNSLAVEKTPIYCSPGLEELWLNTILKETLQF